MAGNGAPVIDMEEASGPVVAQKIVKACEDWGYFRLQNHGIPFSLMSEMKAVSRSFLDLPVEIKTRNSHPEAGKGYVPPNQASPFYDSLSLHDIAAPGSIDNFCAQLDLSPYQREIITKYLEAISDVAEVMIRHIMEGLGLSSSDGGDLFKAWRCQIRMNKYNNTPETVGLTGAIMHSDPGFLTILQDDDIVNGLECVDERTGELVPVDPIPGTFVVIVGDVGKVWSNGRFCNVKHRVQCYEPKVRIAIVFFVLGPKDEKVEALEELVDAEHPRLYAPFDFEDYRKLRTSTRSPTGGALELFRLHKS